MPVTTLVGTAKGAFLATSDKNRERWEIEGPFFKGWKVTASHRLPDGTYLVATASDIYGPALHRSSNLRDWEQIEAGPSYPPDSDRKLKQIWTIASGHGSVYAGVDEAGLFRSDDHGETWRPVPGLNDHPTRSKWFPGAGGLCAHVVLFDPRDPDRLWVGISAVGVFRSDDGGESWVPKNRGVRVIIEDEEVKEIGFCVHGLAQDPSDPDRIYRQDHMGMYRSADGGESWEPNADGLPGNFGFPIATDPTTGAIFAIPLESDEYRIPPDGALRVYRSDDQGDSWHPLGRGLTERHTYTGVLRGCLAVDGLDPGGVYFGTTSGTVHMSRDRGESWTTLPCVLPRILSVSAFADL